MFFPLFNFPFLFITEMSQAQQAAEDMINQTIAKMSFGGRKTVRRKLRQILTFLCSQIHNLCALIRSYAKVKKSELETVIVTSLFFLPMRNEKTFPQIDCI
jgi:hypothetical protein